MDTQKLSSPSAGSLALYFDLWGITKVAAIMKWSDPFNLV